MLAPASLAQVRELHRFFLYKLALLGELPFDVQPGLGDIIRDLARAAFLKVGDLLAGVAVGQREDQRLSAAFPEPPVLVPPTHSGGAPRHVVSGIAVHLGRHVGVTRRELPWI